MNVGAVRQFFLRIASGVSQRAQVERENVPNIHKRMSADRRAFLYRVCSADDVAARSRNLSLNCCGHPDMWPPSSRNGLRSEKRADRRIGSPSSASGPPHVTAYPLRQLPNFQEDHRRLPTTLARGPSGAYGFGSLLTIMAVLQCNRAAPHSRFLATSQSLVGWPPATMTPLPCLLVYVSQNLASRVFARPSASASLLLATISL